MDVPELLFNVALAKQAINTRDRTAMQLLRALVGVKPGAAAAFKRGMCAIVGYSLNEARHRLQPGQHPQTYGFVLTDINRSGPIAAKLLLPCADLVYHHTSLERNGFSNSRVREKTTVTS